MQEEKRTEFALQQMDEGRVLLAQPSLGNRPMLLSASHSGDPEVRLDLLSAKRGSSSNPRDSYNLLYLILVLHGIGTLMPWNMFINAKAYFTEYKLAADNSTNLTNVDSELADYRTNFLGYVTLAAQLPNVLCNFLNLFLQFGARSLTPRIVTSLLIEVAVFIATVIMAMVDSVHWPIAFFYITMGLVVVLNMASGIYQNSIFGVAARLPGKYSNAVVLGSNICGTFTALLNIFSIAASPNARTAAIYYFLSALLVLLLCLDSYFALPLLPCYRHHEQSTARMGSNNRARSPSYLSVLKQVWPQCLNVFLIFFVTLAAFPAVTSDVKRLDPDFPISEKYFTAVGCFFFFNFFAMLGNVLPIWVRWPGPRFLWVCVVLRLVFLPLFLLCNYLPEVRRLPVWVSSDWGYLASMAVFAWSSGYLSSLAMMYAPQTVSTPQQAPIAGMMAAFCLVLGIFIGGNAAFLAPRIVAGSWY